MNHCLDILFIFACADIYKGFDDCEIYCCLCYLLAMAVLYSICDYMRTIRPDTQCFSASEIRNLRNLIADVWEKTEVIAQRRSFSVLIIHLKQTLHLEKHREEWHFVHLVLHSTLVVPNPAHTLKAVRKGERVTFNSSQVPMEASAVRSSEKHLK